MKKHQPRPWPLIQRFGWFIGLLTWGACRRNGCDWWIIPWSKQRLSEFVTPTGTRHLCELTKWRCASCESVCLVHIHITVLPGGAVFCSVPEWELFVRTA